MIGYYWQLLVKKNNLSNGFKLKPVITYNLKFVVM